MKTITKLKKYLYSWSLARFLRLAIGIAVVVQGILAGDKLFITIGALFSLMPLLNAGCGAGGSCNTGSSFGRPESPENFSHNPDAHE